MTPVDLLDAEKRVEQVFFYVSRIAFTASLFVKFFSPGSESQTGHLEGPRPSSSWAGRWLSPPHCGQTGDKDDNGENVNNVDKVNSNDNGDNGAQVNKNNNSDNGGNGDKFDNDDNGDNGDQVDNDQQWQRH